ncbi:MAG TPA: EamA family transporter, partial [Opitutaceae bacterium]|nr:EamA family transporter [Opitutaceae bacterium]
MAHLILVSFLWAFSFGLIKRHLVGLDSAFVTAARLGLALLIFLPFLRIRRVSGRTAAGLAALGAVQFGVMYLAYIESFRYLQAYEAALFTITTPILVTLFADAFDRTLRLRALAAALLAVAGTACVMVKSANLSVTFTGFALVQLSNAAFAIGQVLYRRWRARSAAVRDREVFGLLYAGGFVVALAAVLSRDVSVSLTAKQSWTLLYLGVLASGAGFFLWNVGATKVSAATLAVMNNAKVPLAVVVALLFFGEAASVPWLVASLALLGGAVFVANPKQQV